jgi:hypothetical protein
MTDIIPVIFRNPITGENAKKIVLFGPMPKNVRETIASNAFNKKILHAYFGDEWRKKLFIKASKEMLGGDDFDIDFENVAEENNAIDITELGSKINYITNVTIYDSDSMIAFKEKIFIATGIPIFRQYIYIEEGQSNKSGHTILLSNVKYAINFENDTEDFNGIKIDKNIYNNREYLRIKTNEPHKLISSFFGKKIYLVDLQYYKNELKNVANILHANYLTDLLYYGLFCKYFPMFDITMMKLYFENENALFTKYSFSFKQQNFLQKQYDEENKILGYYYENSERLYSQYKDHIQICIYSIEYESLKLFSIADMVFIRNLLNIFSCDENYIFIMADVLKDGTYFRITKYFSNQNRQIIANILDNKSKFAFYEKFTIIIRDPILGELQEFCLYPDGKYSMRIFFPNNLEYDFERAFKYAKNYADKIISHINQNANNVFNVSFAKLQEFKLENMDITDININIKWNRLLEMKKFTGLNAILERYINANLFSRRVLSVTSPSIINLLIRKGINFQKKKFLKRKGVEATNYYSIFFDQNSFNIWSGRYKGKIIDVENNITNLAFRIQNVNDTEVDSILNIILVLIEEIDNFIGEVKSIKSENLNTKKKLKETDPMLYIFRDKKGNKYSRICQKKFRPTNIYLREEYDNLPEEKRKKLHKFINYTTSEDVWYECPAKLPYLGFITGKHPKGFCIPRCKASETEGKKNLAIKNDCASKHSFEHQQSELSRINTIKFGKTLEMDKPGRIHPIMYKMFPEVNEDEIYILGCPQTYNGIIGTYLLEVAAIAMQITINDLLTSLIEKNPELENLKNASILTNGITSTSDAISTNISDGNISDIENTIMKALYDAHKIKVVIFKTEIYEQNEILDEKNSSVEIYISDIIVQKILTGEDIKLLFAVEVNDKYFPLIYEMSGIFQRGNLLFDTFKYMIDNNLLGIKSKDENKFSYKNILAKLMAIYTPSNIIKYVHGDYVKYLTAGKICVGIYNSVCIDDKIKVSYKNFDARKYSVDALLDFLGEKLKNVTLIAVEQKPIIEMKPVNICGIKIGKIYCWFAQEKYSNMIKRLPNAKYKYFNCLPYEVNNAILANEPSCNLHLQNISDTYYKIYIYKLLKYEIFKQMLKCKNTKMHADISDAYKSENMHTILEKIKYSNKKDYYILMNIIKNSSNVLDDISKTVFNFDIENIVAQKKQLSQERVYEEILAYVQNFAILLENVNTSFDVPNIIISYTDTDIADESLFYKDAKLKLNRNEYKELVLQISRDIKNDLKFLYEINNYKAFFIVNYFVFALNSKEKIKIDYY